MTPAETRIRELFGDRIENNVIILETRTDTGYRMEDDERIPIVSKVGVSLKDFMNTFGEIFTDGKPTFVQFQGVCNAIPQERPVDWADPWPPSTWCRGYCTKYGELFRSEGILI
jgi:hypothetical protein